MFDAFGFSIAFSFFESQFSSYEIPKMQLLLRHFFFSFSSSWMAIIPCGSTWVARCGQPRLTLTSSVANKCTYSHW